MLPQPHYSEPFGDQYLLWFDTSNSYSWVDKIFYEFLQVYFKSKSEKDFIDKSQSNYDGSALLYKAQFKRIENYLKSFVSQPQNNKSHKIIPNNNQVFFKKYSIGQKILELSFSRKEDIELIHPFIAHLEVDCRQSNDLFIHIRSDKNYLILQKEDEELELFQSSEYHKLQGRLLLYIINLLHQTEEHEWMGIFHASAVSKHGIGYLFTGTSGSGKSTLVSLLSAHGFNLIADDAVPVRASDQKIYTNPTAVSIKKKSLPVIGAFWSNQKVYKKVNSPKGKGLITYIPMQTVVSLDGIPCSYIIKTNYQKNHPAQLSSLNPKTSLETLIPESWISPIPNNAKSFMDWMKNVQFFELTYSDFQEALKLLEDLNK